MRIARQVIQSGNDTSTRVEIDTDLAVDGRAGWQIRGIRVLWEDCVSVAAADWFLSFVLTTTNADPSYAAWDDVIAGVYWGLQNTAAVAVAVPVEPVKTHMLDEPRVIAADTIYAGIISTATGATNQGIIEVFYDIVKLSDLEVLRLRAAGS